MKTLSAPQGFAGCLACACLLAAAVVAPMISRAAGVPKSGSPESIIHKHLVGAVGVEKEGGFDASFLKLDSDNQKLFDGVDVLDEDPVCGCQDTGGKYSVSGKADGPDRYVATVSNTESHASWQVILHRIDGVWKIWDVVDDGGSVRGLLERHNACARDRIAHHKAVDDCANLK